jgi:hypothetical protein
MITEFIKEVSPLLPDPCHFQDYDRSIFPLSPHSGPGMCIALRCDARLLDVEKALPQVAQA